MDIRITRKSVFSLFAALSLSAFLFVNLHVNLVVRKQVDAAGLLIREKMEQKEEPKREVPTLALIGQVAKLLYHIAPSLR
jgi:hypothetical protein